VVPGTKFFPISRHGSPPPFLLFLPVFHRSLEELKSVTEYLVFLLPEGRDFFLPFVPRILLFFLFRYLEERPSFSSGLKVLALKDHFSYNFLILFLAPLYPSGASRVLTFLPDFLPVFPQFFESVTTSC